MPRWYSAEYVALSAEMAKTASLQDRIRLAKAMNDMLMQDYAMIPLIHRGWSFCTFQHNFRGTDERMGLRTLEYC